jgi:hypothetical protein
MERFAEVLGSFPNNDEMSKSSAKSEQRTAKS